MARIRRIVIMALAALALLASNAFAADPLAVDLRELKIYRHVLESNDWLVLGRYHLTPTQQSGLNTTDSVTATVTSGDFDAPVTLTNKVTETSAADFNVIVTGSTTDITSTCTLQENEQSLDCVTTGLANGSHSLTVTYRAGWDAYGGGAAFLRLKSGATVIKQRTLPRVGYGLVALYLSADEVSDNGLIWQGGTISAEILGAPTLWAAPDSDTAAITWRSTASLAATETQLTTDLRSMLRYLETSAGLSSGTYVQSTGITDAGLTLAQEAFGQITKALPEAFLSSVYNPWPSVLATPTPANYIRSIETPAASSTVGQAFEGILDQFTGDISGHAAGGIVFGVLGLVVLAVCWVGLKTFGFGIAGLWVIFMIGWLLGGLPGVWPFLSGALVAAYGLSKLAMKVLSEQT